MIYSNATATRSTSRRAHLSVMCLALLTCAACSSPARFARGEVDTDAQPTLPEGVSEAAAPEAAAADPAAPEPSVSEPVTPEATTAEGPGDEQALKQANNPLANIKAINLQNYYIPNLSGTDETANQFWLRYATPLKIAGGDWLMRASLPLVTAPTGGFDSESGIGDSNVFASYLFETDDPSISMGVGPLLGIPTATDDALGTGQWSAGAAAVYFDASSAHFQWGGLVTYQHKFAGSSADPDVNFLAVQPFGVLQMGGGLYARSTGIWGFDLQTGNYSVPIGLGLGKVVKVGKTVFNVFLEPQFTVLSEGAGQPQFQLFFGFNTQFLGG